MLIGAIYTTIFFMILFICVGVAYISLIITKLHKYFKTGIKINLTQYAENFEFEGNDRY